MGDFSIGKMQGVNIGRFVKNSKRFAAAKQTRTPSFLCNFQRNQKLTKTNYDNEKEPGDLVIRCVDNTRWE